MKQCEVCGLVDNKVSGKTGKYGRDLCLKHRWQMDHYGQIATRTKQDPNEFIVDGDILWITIYDKNQQESCKAKINAKHYDKVKDYKWSVDSGGYIISTTKGRGNTARLHRIVTDCPDNMVVDHINHDLLDNTDENLRICTQQENMWNRALSPRNTSGYPGVHWMKSMNKWYASIQVSNKTKSLGYYIDIQDAINARREGEILYWNKLVL